METIVLKFRNYPVSLSFLRTKPVKIYDYKLCLMYRKFAALLSLLLHVKEFHYEENSLSDLWFERWNCAFLRQEEKNT